jgi:hypothetical protein
MYLPSFCDKNLLIAVLYERRVRIFSFFGNVEENGAVFAR